MINLLNLFFVLLLFDKSLTKGVKEKDNKNDTKHWTRNTKQMSHIDFIIEEFSNQEWDADELICYDKTLKIMNNVKNSTLWATWIWDSMQNPTGHLYGSRYHLGNYDECLKAPWLETYPEYLTQYCLADLILSDETEKLSKTVDPQSPVEIYIKSDSKHGVVFNVITWGVCLPVECQSNSISKFVKALFKSSHLGSSVPKLDISVDSCQTAGESIKYPTEYYITIYVMVFFTLLTISFTILNNKQRLESNTIGNNIIRAFCMKTNFDYLSHSSKSDIKVIHGMRSLSSAIVVGLHLFIVTIWIGINNPLDLERDIERFSLASFVHAELVVDTYLMMSGLFLMKNLMASGKINPFIIILKRYLRFASMLGLLLLVATKVLIYSGDGPLWPRISGSELRACEKNWWINLLMLGNYVDTANICYPISWTLPCDFHLSAIGTIIFWLYQRNRRVGLFTFLSFGIAALVMPGVVTYQQNISAIPYLNIKTMAEFRIIFFSNPTYIWSHLRAGPYFVGIIAGYFLSIYKPANHRKIISKLWSAIGFITSFYVAMLVMVKGGDFCDKKTYNALGAALFASFNRSIWASAIAFMIIFCEYGSVPIIGAFLRWKVFVPLSKLSYGVYLVHLLVILHAGTTRTPLRMHLFVLIENTFGIIAISCIVSLLIHLLFLAPLSNIMNIPKIRTTKNERKENEKFTEHNHVDTKMQVKEKKTV